MARMYTTYQTFVINNLNKTRQNVAELDILLYAMFVRGTPVSITYVIYIYTLYIERERKRERERERAAALRVCRYTAQKLYFTILSNHFSGPSIRPHAAHTRTPYYTRLFLRMCIENYYHNSYTVIHII